MISNYEITCVYQYSPEGDEYTVVAQYEGHSELDAINAMLGDYQISDRKIVNIELVVNKGEVND